MSPSMPSGAVLTRDEWEAACEILGEHERRCSTTRRWSGCCSTTARSSNVLHVEGMADRTVIAGSLARSTDDRLARRGGRSVRPTCSSRSAGCTSTTPRRRPASRAAATAVLRGDQGHVADATRELERRRDTIMAALDGWPLVRPAGGWSLLVDAVALGTTAELSKALLEHAAIAATPMTGWGGDVAGRHLRLVFSAEPVERLETIPERMAGTCCSEAYGSSPRSARVAPRPTAARSPPWSRRTIRPTRRRRRVELVRLQLGDRAHRRLGERDQVRVAVHEADPAAVRDHLDDVAREQRAAGMQHGPAGEVAPQRIRVSPSPRSSVSPSHSSSRRSERVIHSRSSACRYTGQSYRCAQSTMPV